MRIRLFVILVTLVFASSIYTLDFQTLGSVGIYEGRPSYVAIPVTHNNGCVTWTTTSVLRLASGQTVLLISRFFEPKSFLIKVESSSYPDSLEIAWQSAIDSELFYSVSECVLVSQLNKLDTNLYSEWACYLLIVPENVATLHLYDDVSGRAIYAGPIFPVEYDNVQF